ncbi:MAG: hypothetical protein ACREIA_17050 [Opitutaceae bacterium]
MSELDALREERSRITFRFDRIRGACAGILETGAYTFGLVIAIRYFEAPQAVKAMVSGATPLGLLLTPLSLFFFTRAGWTAARAATLNFVLGAVFLAVAALAQSLAIFVCTMAPGFIFLAQQSPLLVHIYTSNYAPSRRGRMLSSSTVLNGFFLVAILTFFSTKNIWVIGLAGGLIGMAMAGSNIAWNLWVTKFAPPDRVSEYMSVHTFLTGVRGVIAPFAGFWLIVRCGPMTTACICAGLIALSMILLDPLRRKHREQSAASV